jgi:hypothetical protein
MPALPPTVLVLPLAAAAALVRDPRARALAALGIVAYLLPLAALRLDGWAVSPFLAPAVPQVATPFLVATGGLVVAAALAWAAAGYTGRAALRGAPRGTPIWSAVAAVLTIAGLFPAGPVLAAAGPLRAVTAGVGIAAAVGLLARAGAVLRLRALLSRMPCAPGPRTSPTSPAAHAPWVVGLLLIALGPHLHVVFSGTALLLALVAREDLRARSTRAAVADAVAVLALLGAWWLIGTIAGVDGGWMRKIDQLPLSPAAEYLLVPLLAVVLFRLAGVPPLDGTGGAGLAAAAMLLAWRAVLPLLPAALPAWSAGVLAAAAVGATLAGAARRVDLLLAAVGLGALLAGGEPGRLGGALLLVAAALARPGFRVAGFAVGIRVALAVTLAWSAGEALTGTLSAEVVYSVVLAVGAVACAWPPRG